MNSPKDAMRPSPWEEMDPRVRYLLKSILYEWMHDLERFGPVPMTDESRVANFLCTLLTQFEAARSAHITAMQGIIAAHDRVTPHRELVNATVTLVTEKNRCPTCKGTGLRPAEPLKDTNG